MKLNRELSQLHWLEDFHFYFPFYIRKLSCKQNKSVPPVWEARSYFLLIANS
jgi:hypothetical protein